MYVETQMYSLLLESDIRDDIEYFINEEFTMATQQTTVT